MLCGWSGTSDEVECSGDAFGGVSLGTRVGGCRRNRVPFRPNCVCFIRSDRALHEYLVLSPVVFSFSQPSADSSRRLGNSDTGGWRLADRIDREIRLGKNPWPRNTGSDGGSSCFAQPYRSESGISEAAFGGDRHWNGRAVRRRRAHYSNGRRVWLAYWTNSKHYRGRAKSDVGLRWRSG